MTFHDPLAAATVFEPGLCEYTRASVEVDAQGRTTLAAGKATHPLLRRVMQIHITEEARHICFAREYLRHHVPLLTPALRWIAQLRIAPNSHDHQSGRSNKQACASDRPQDDR